MQSLLSFIISRMELCEAIYFFNTFYRVASQLEYSEDVVCMPAVLIFIDFVRRSLTGLVMCRWQPVTMCMTSHRLIT